MFIVLHGLIFDKEYAGRDQTVVKQRQFEILRRELWMQHLAPNWSIPKGFPEGFPEGF